MVRTNGLKTKYKPLEVVSKADDIYIIRWHYVELDNINYQTRQVTETDLAVWTEEYFYHKPAIDELRKLFIKYYNDITENKILSGFVWNDIPVWLSEENQRNYKAAYDIAVQTDGANLPIEFKFGTEDQPVYQIFHSVKELQEFYMPAIQHIQQCLTDGWRLKDVIDYSLYEV